MNGGWRDTIHEKGPFTGPFCVGDSRDVQAAAAAAP